MTISKKQLQEACKESYEVGKYNGIVEGNKKAKEEFSSQKAEALNKILHSASELAQANAKLTYALSRIVNEKGW